MPGLRRLVQVWFVGMLLGGLSGCVSLQKQGEIDTQVRYDSYGKSLDLKSDLYKVPGLESYFNPVLALVHLRGSIWDDGSELMQLYVHYTSFDGSVLFESAQDHDGKILPFTYISYGYEGHKTVAEDFAATINKAYLVAHQSQGLDIRFDGRRGSVIVKLPPNYVQGFLRSWRVAEANARQRGVQIALDAEDIAQMNVPSPASCNTQPALGVDYGPVNTLMAVAANMPSVQGVFIGKVKSGSSAERAGLRVGDIILAADSKLVPNDAYGLRDWVRTLAPCSRVTMEIWREGHQMMLQVQF